MKTTIITRVTKVTFLFLSLLLVAGCTDQSSDPTAADQNEPALASAPGEADTEEHSDGDLSENMTYLLNLSLMRGHLYVGEALYKDGHVEHAKTHMKHPESELYALVVPVLDANDSQGFATELETLAVAVETEQDQDTVSTAYTALTTGIGEAESLVPEHDAGLHRTLLLIEQILLVAGEEYGIAFVDGQLENAHEYQDSLGFVHVAKTMLENSATSSAEQLETKTKALAVLAELQPMWPSLIPPETITTQATQLYAAADNIHALVHH